VDSRRQGLSIKLRRICQTRHMDDSDRPPSQERAFDKLTSSIDPRFTLLLSDFAVSL